MNIYLLYTGGTIGCVGTPLKPMKGGCFEKAFKDHVEPIITTQINGISISYDYFSSPLDSTNLQPSDWVTIAKKILDNYSQHDAFLVLHGTDTMAWTASALSFLFTGLSSSGVPNAALNKPIIVTGSQLPLFYEEKEGSEISLLYNTDALQNVCGAVAAAGSNVPEVCLYFNATLFRGNRTLKTNASKFDAFSAPNYPNLGEYGVEFYLNNQNILPHPPKEISLESGAVRQSLAQQLQHLRDNIKKTKIVPFLAFPAYSDTANGSAVLADMLDSLISQGVNGIILESYGEGNFPSGNPDDPTAGAIYNALKEAHEKEIVLIDCTQVLRGIVNANAYAAGSWLGQAGAVGDFDMTPIAALAKLIVLSTLRNYSSYNWSQATIERLMVTNLAGEIMDVDRLSPRGRMFLAPGETITALGGAVILENSFERGPILYRLLPDNKRDELWIPVNFQTTTMPGTLYMQGDCNLVFYDSTGSVAYSSDTARVGVAAPVLILHRDNQEQKIKLSIFNYATGAEIKTLYPNSLLIKTKDLPMGRPSSHYTTVLQGEGGIPPYSWETTGLPDGLELNSQTGEISGSSHNVGTYPITVVLMDSGDRSATAQLQLAIHYVVS